VIIPTHNRAALLQRALDSVFSQWGLGVEFDLDVIIVDDGSTDSTAAVVAEFSQVRCLRLSSQRGASAARNAGIKTSRGAFICFLDDDDVWLPGRLRLQLPVLQRHPKAGAVYSQVLNTDSGKAYPSSSRAVSGQIFEALLAGNFMCVHSVLVRKEALDETGYFDEELSTYEDWDLWFRLSLRFPFVFAPGLVGVYLVSPRGLWQSAEREKENTERVIEKALQMLPDSTHSAELRRITRGRLALEYGKTWSEVLDVLRTYAFLVRYGWARHRVSRWMRKLALASESPLATLQKLCSELTEVGKCNAGVRNGWGIRQTVAKSWAETACSLAARPTRQKDAAYAAMHAVILKPSLLLRGALAPIIIRGVLAFCIAPAPDSNATPRHREK
jgi:glycosyltransferase involved in cell wall biosynthesis